MTKRDELSALVCLERPTLQQAVDALVIVRRANDADDPYRFRLCMAVDQLERAWGAHNGEREYRSWFAA